MVTRQTLVVVSVVLMATLAVVVPAVSAAPASSGDGPADRSTMAQVALQTDENATANASSNESDFGNQMTAFMQSNAAQTEDTVEHGMWESAFEQANESKKARLAHKRAEQLNGRLAELREANRTLYERYQNGSISHDEFVARASELSGRIEALQDGVNGTARAAKQAGVNVSALNELRENARNLTGPKVAGIARNLTSGDGGPPASIPGRGPPGEDGTDRPGGGPPEDAPGGQNAGPGNGTDVANVTAGPQGGPNAPQGNETSGPGAPGNGNDGSPGDGAGQGDGGPGGNDGGDGASGNGNSGDGAGNSGPGGDAPGNDDGSDGASGNDSSGDAPGNDGSGDAPGNSGGGNDGDTGGQDTGDGNAGGGNGGGPAAILLTDILFSH